MATAPILYIIIPCYNEEKVLKITAPLFLRKLNSLIDEKKVSEDSRLLYINDGSRDTTWDIIKALSERDVHCQGISLSRNMGHQNALLAGLMEAKEHSDITISADCDGQDDLDAMDAMVDRYLVGDDVVYGVRNKRATDTFLKKYSAEFYYRLLKWLGADIVYNHADYRLLSSKALKALEEFHEVNLFLRGMVPLVGYSHSYVYYERTERLAGTSHYSISRMMSLAIDGITSFSIRPLRMIISFGLLVALLSFIGVIWSIAARFTGNYVNGWASMTCIICFVSGVQLLSLGIIAEYIGKIYLEVKHRPRYIISERIGIPE